MFATSWPPLDTISAPLVWEAADMKLTLTLASDVTKRRSMNCASLTQRRRRTSSSRIIAMWAAGPPKATTPRRRNTLTTSRSGLIAAR